MKTIKKTLNNNTSIWVDYFKEALTSCSKAGIFNLCQSFPQSYYNNLRPFFKEVMIAWKKVRPWLKVQVTNADHVLRQPIYYNADITNDGKPVHSVFFERANIHTIADILDDQENISTTKVLNKLQQNKAKFRTETVRTVIENINKEFPIEWKRLLKQRKQPRQTDTLNFALKEQKHKLLTECNNKIIYTRLIKQIIKPPTARSTWSILMPELNTALIWTNIDINPLPQEVFNMEFKIRHRKIFTATVLDQMNKDKYTKNCTFCTTSIETLEHLFLECTACNPFRDSIWEFLKKRYDFSPQGTSQKTLHFLSGLLTNNKIQNQRIINLILAFGKYTIYYARNLKLFENKDINRWDFKNYFNKHCQLLFHAAKEGFIKHYICQNTVFHILENDLHINF